MKRDSLKNRNGVMVVFQFCLSLATENLTKKFQTSVQIQKNNPRSGNIPIIYEPRLCKVSRMNFSSY